MSLHSNTLAELVVRLLKLPLRDYRGGTCTTAVSTTSFKDSSRKESDDFFQNTTPISWVHIISTTDGAEPIGEEAQISDFANTDGTITFGPAITTVAAGDKYVILSDWRWHELTEAVNSAIDIATSNNILIEKTDETSTVQADTYEYLVPTGFTHIYRISQADGDGDFPEAIPPDHYKIIRGAPIPRIHFYRFPTEQLPRGHYAGEMWIDSDLEDGRYLRIEGFARQPQLESENEICQIDPNFIVWQAAGLLHSARITQEASDYDNHRIQAEICEVKAREFLADAKRACQFPANCKKVMR